MSSDKNNTAKKLTGSIITIIILICCLTITTYALVMEVSVKDNYFATGLVDININDGKPVIEEHEFLFEPGMTVEKDFFIENNSTWAVYYKIYMDNTGGGLADVLQITVKDGEEILCSGTANQLTQKNVAASEAVLQVNERRDLTISFYFPKEAGNSVQNSTLTFDLCAQAVQTKNNPDKLFE